MTTQCAITGSHNLEILRGMNSNACLLTVNGGNQSIFMYPVNDGSGRMEWFIDEVAQDIYTIKVVRGIPFPVGYLTWDLNSDGIYLSQAAVDSQQQWKITPVPNSPTCCTYYIQPAAKSNYLSAGPNGNVLQYKEDDGTGRQRWQFQENWVTK